MSTPSTRDQIHAGVIAALRERREAIGMSMTRLAQRSGLSLGMISLTERNLRKPTLDTLLRISEALDVELWEVLRTASSHGSK